MILLFHAEGCPHCVAALAEFQRFKSRNPTQMALEFDADGPYAQHFGVAPVKETPLYLLHNGEDGVRHAGIMKAEQLEKWMKAAAKEIGA